MTRMIIKKVKGLGNVFDVFVGEGWSTHARVHVKEKHVHILQGIKTLSKAQFAYIVKHTGG